ncbi:MAG: hypothetical protein ACI8QS_003137 [Planctomycetota bacterium]|jgi:hypothetical protein
MLGSEGVAARILALRVRLACASGVPVHSLNTALSGISNGVRVSKFIFFTSFLGAVALPGKYLVPGDSADTIFQNMRAPGTDTARAWAANPSLPEWTSFHFKTL